MEKTEASNTNSPSKPKQPQSNLPFIRSITSNQNQTTPNLDKNFEYIKNILIENHTSNAKNIELDLTTEKPSNQNTSKPRQTDQILKNRYPKILDMISQQTLEALEFPIFWQDKNLGLGLKLSQNGELYKGQFSNYEYSGIGLIEYLQTPVTNSNLEESSYYIGQFSNNKKNGIGYLSSPETTSNTASYLGYFVDDSKYGYGILIQNNTTLQIQSDFIGENFYNGFSIISDTANNYHYKGFLNQEGHPEHFGKLKTNLELYFGGFLNGIKHGVGTCENHDSEIKYIGQWSNSNKYGFGEEFNKKTGEIYKGEYKNNIKSGFGSIYTISDHSIFTGQFVKNTRQGIGILDDKKDLLCLGNWINGHMNGLGYKKHQREYHFGFWKNGKRNGFGYEINSKYAYKGHWKDDKQDGFGVMKVFSNSHEGFRNQKKDQHQHKSSGSLASPYTKNSVVSPYTRKFGKANNANLIRANLRKQQMLKDFTTEIDQFIKAIDISGKFSQERTQFINNVYYQSEELTPMENLKRNSTCSSLDLDNDVNFYYNKNGLCLGINYKDGNIIGTYENEDKIVSILNELGYLDQSQFVRLMSDKLTGIYKYINTSYKEIYNKKKIREDEFMALEKGFAEKVGDIGEKFVVIKSDVDQLVENLGVENQNIGSLDESDLDGFVGDYIEEVYKQINIVEQSNLELPKMEPIDCDINEKKSGNQVECDGNYTAMADKNILLDEGNLDSFIEAYLNDTYSKLDLNNSFNNSFNNHNNQVISENSIIDSPEIKIFDKKIVLEIDYNSQTNPIALIEKTKNHKPQAPVPPKPPISRQGNFCMTKNINLEKSMGKCGSLPQLNNPSRSARSTQNIEKNQFQEIELETNQKKAKEQRIESELESEVIPEFKLQTQIEKDSSDINDSSKLKSATNNQTTGNKPKSKKGILLNSTRGVLGDDYTLSNDILSLKCSIKSNRSENKRVLFLEGIIDNEYKNGIPVKKIPKCVRSKKGKKKLIKRDDIPEKAIISNNEENLDLVGYISPTFNDDEESPTLSSPIIDNSLNVKLQLVKSNSETNINTNYVKISANIINNISKGIRMFSKNMPSILPISKNTKKEVLNSNKGSSQFKTPEKKVKDERLQIDGRHNLSNSLIIHEATNEESTPLGTPRLNVPKIKVNSASDKKISCSEKPLPTFSKNPEDTDPKFNQPIILPAQKKPNIELSSPIPSMNSLCSFGSPSKTPNIIHQQKSQGR